jgi:hypothetical protein
MEGLKNNLEVQAAFDPKAVKSKAEEFVDRRFRGTDKESVHRSALQPALAAQTQDEKGRTKPDIRYGCFRFHNSS